MSTKVGAEIPRALLPSGDAGRRGEKASGVVQIMLLIFLVVAVLAGLTCDVVQYHGVDIRGRPIYPEKSQRPSWEMLQTSVSP